VPTGKLPNKKYPVSGSIVYKLRIFKLVKGIVKDFIYEIILGCPWWGLLHWAYFSR
jgi:hypothetical protein